MDIQEYIESGILELYVYGALTPQESEEVSKVLKQYPDDAIGISIDSEEVILDCDNKDDYYSILSKI